MNVVAEVADENRRNTDLTLSMPPLSERISNLQKEKDKDNIDRNLLDISREASVKDLTERLQVLNYSLIKQLEGGGQREEIEIGENLN